MIAADRCLGSETDPFLEGQSAQTPLAETLRGGVACGVRVFPCRELGARGYVHIAMRPYCHIGIRDSRDLGVPLYECGILVHCLAYHGSWLWGRITDDTDRAAVPST